jgi:DNA mismatch repair ATPase MutS
VVNDVTVGPAGTLLLVTGSNMSGKSTLLRALGTNVALAQAGGPVCAERLALPPVVLATSIRVDDSLEEGISFFMAELKRLKEIVDLAGRHGSAAGGTHRNKMVLYLLDEILLGTNSAERHIAVERVLGHLIRQGAIGAVTTHDLELASSPILKGACQTVHFRESFASENDNQRMKFDYHLHPGVATTRNALKLLEMVGLAEGWETCLQVNLKR